MGAIESGIRLAAMQHSGGTIAAAHRLLLWVEPAAWWASHPYEAFRMTVPKPRQIFIQGVTLEGKTFRPSDWAERLAGAMACFRPGGVVRGGGIGAFIGYSPYCVPRVINGVKCVIVNEALRDVEPMAWDFVMHFARDNHLQTSEACLLPEPDTAKTPLK